MLNYGKPQILEVFKNTLPSCLYWVLFPIKKLRQAVDLAKGILTKERLNRQLSGKGTGTPSFLTMKEKNEQSHNMVVFNESNVIGTEIDKLICMLGKLSVRQSKPFEPKVYQGRG